MEIPIPHHEFSDNITIKIEENSDTENCLEDKRVYSSEQLYPSGCDTFFSTKTEHTNFEIESQSDEMTPSASCSSTIKTEVDSATDGKQQKELRGTSLFCLLEDIGDIEEENFTAINEDENGQSDSDSDYIEDKVRCKELKCNFYFPTEEEMQRHVHIAHNVENQFKCETCAERFNDDNSLKDHILNVHPRNKSYNHCCFCGKLYEREKDLSSHYSSSHKQPYPFQCAFCTEMHQNREDLFKHTTQVHPEVIKGKSWVCRHCKENHPSRSQLKRHVKHCPEKKTIVDKFTVTCEFCTLICQNPEDLINHTNQFHPKRNEVDIGNSHSEVENTIDAIEMNENENGSSDDDSDPDYVEEKVRCKELKCNLYFRTQEKMHKHFRQMHKFSVKNALECKTCGMKFCDRSYLLDHILTVHEKNNLYNPCSFCGKLYESKKDLSLHYSNSHQEPNPFQCAFCTKIYQSREDLIRHTDEAHPKVDVKEDGYKELHCPYCPSQFSNLRRLKKHIFCSHDEVIFDRAVECSICGKRYLGKDKLTLHYSNSHKEPNPFQCAFCSVLHTNRKDLVQHTNLFHPGVDDDERELFNCFYCEKNFANSEILERHIFCTHEKQKIMYNFQCRFCGKNYPGENERTLHYSNSHQEPNPFQCAFCPELYTNCEDLTQHTKDTHPDPEKPKFECDVCAAMCSSLNAFRAHNQRYHADEKNRNNLELKCCACAMKFITRKGLNWHLLRHNEPNKNCDKCEMRFHTSKAILKHMRKCPEEGGRSKRRKSGQSMDTAVELKRRKLTQSENRSGKDGEDDEELKSHSGVHQNPNAFRCDTCGKSFKSVKPLKRHLELHDESATNVKCKMCNKRFLSQKSCEQHESSHLVHIK